MSKKTHHHPDDMAEEKLHNVSEEATQSELLQKVAAAEQKANDYWDRLLRLQAENDNAKRRAERDVEQAHKYALEKFTAELLPIIDSLELGLASSQDHLVEGAKAVVEGVELTLKMFYAALEKFGIQQVNPLNEQFDPEFQQAISMQYDAKAKPGTVLSVLQKGYTLNNRLVRPALVVVSTTDKS